MSMATKAAAAIVALICTGVLAACAAAQSPSAAGASGSPVASGSPGGPVTILPSSGSTGGPGAGGGGKSPQAGDETLTGQVEAGVEPGCLIMRTGGQTYLLMSGDPAVVKAGASVVVTGHITTGIMSYCQQGQPFTVTTARSN